MSSSGAALSRAQANATYLPWATGGNTFVALGDSTVLGSDTAAGDGTVGGAAPASIQRKDSWPAYLAMLSGGRAIYVANAGIGGNTSTDVVARFQTDVITRAPRFCPILIGTNDAGNSVPLATYSANVKTVVTTLQAAGITPVLCTIAPNGTGAPANRKQQITLFNAWLRRYAEANSITLLDFYSVLVDPTTGGYLVAFDSGDHTHPNAAGYMAMATHAAARLASTLPLHTPLLAWDNNDPNNLVTNGLNINSAGGISTGWTAYATPSSGTVTPSIVTDVNLPGNGQRLTAAGPTVGLGGYKFRFGSGFSVGDRLAISGVMSNAGMTGAIWVVCNGSTNATNFSPITSTRDITRGYFYGELVVPTGTTSIDLVMSVPAGSAGTVDLYQETIYNLTAGGIVTP